MPNGEESKDAKTIQDAHSGDGPGKTNVSSQWIIIFTILLGVLAGFLFFGFVRMWPSCPEPTGESVTVTPTPVSAALSPGQPGLTWVLPQAGTIAGGQPVKMIGVGLSKASTATFGGVTVKPTGADETSVSVTTPAHEPGKVDVVVVDSTGQKFTLVNGYTYLADFATITTVSPSTLPVGGGVINIVGTNFLKSAVVSIGGVPSRAVTVDSSTSLTVMAPPHKSGRVDIAVANIDGQRTVKADGIAYACPAPTGQSLFVLLLLTGALGGMVHTLRSFGWYTGNQKLMWSWMPRYFLVPLTGAALGLVFYLMLGSGFLPPSGTSADTSLVVIALTALVGMFTEPAVLKLKQIAEVVLAKPETGADHAPTSSSTPSMTSPADAAALPAITSLSEEHGPVAGGTAVTIQGTHFAAGAKVQFGDVLATDSVSITATSIALRTPPQKAAGVVNVIVKNPDGKSATKQDGFKYE